MSRKQVIEWLEIGSDEAGTPEFDALLAPFRVVTGKTPDDERFWVVEDKQSEALDRIGVDVSSVRRRILESGLRKVRKRE